MLKKSFLFISVFSCLSTSTWAEENTPIKEIIWLQSYTPPFHIAKNEDAPQGGICDNLTEQLINEIDDVKHTRLIVPQERINKYLNEGQNICFPCVIHKKVNNHLFNYSTPTTVYPPFNIITTKELAPELSNKHGSPIKLINLLADPSYVYGQAAARKYTDKINTIIENTTAHHKASLSWSSENESQAVISRLSHGFLDYSIDYPFMSDYFIKHSKFKNIVSLAIEEDNREYVLGAVGCAANAPNNFAKQAISKINKALKNKVLNSEKYQQSQQFWLKQSFPEFSSHFKQQVLPITEQPTAELASTSHLSKD